MDFPLSAVFVSEYILFAFSVGIHTCVCVLFAVADVNVVIVPGICDLFAVDTVFFCSLNA